MWLTLLGTLATPTKVNEAMREPFERDVNEVLTTINSQGYLGLLGRCAAVEGFCYLCDQPPWPTVVREVARRMGNPLTRIGVWLRAQLFPQRR